MRAILRVAPPAAQQLQVDEWLALPFGGARAVVAESGVVPLAVPDGVALARLPAGCVCCVGQVPLRVTLTRIVRATRPEGLLLLLATPDHLPRVRALLADGSLGVQFNVE